MTVRRPDRAASIASPWPSPGTGNANAMPGPRHRSGAVVLAVAALTVATLAATGCSGSGTGGSSAAASGSAASGSQSSPTTTGEPGSSGAPGAPLPATAPGEAIVISAVDLPDISAVGVPGPATPQRIVSLATGVGETLVALGVGDRVVGRDETSEVPTQAAVVTEAHSVSAERVIALDPDLVIVDARTTPPEALQQIEAAGARVVEVPEAWTLADMGPRARAIADAIAVDAAPLLATLPGAATASPDSPDGTASAAAGASPDPSPGADAPRVAFLYLRGTSAIYLLGGQGSGADALIAAAGGVDAGAEAGLEAFTPLTAEALVALDPDVLLVMTGGLDSVNGVDGLVALPGVSQTTAGRERRVIAVDDEVLLSFGPRTGALVDLLRVALTRAASTSP
ncbi:MAG: hemin ABC transporter substrate-binding protein [Actinomycetota bacterium]